MKIRKRSAHHFPQTIILRRRTLIHADAAACSVRRARCSISMGVESGEAAGGLPDAAVSAVCATWGITPQARIEVQWPCGSTGHRPRTAVGVLERPTSGRAGIAAKSGSGSGGGSQMTLLHTEGKKILKPHHPQAHRHVIAGNRSKDARPGDLPHPPVAGALRHENEVSLVEGHVCRRLWRHVEYGTA